MPYVPLLIGSQIASKVPEHCANGRLQQGGPESLGQLIDILAQDPPASMPMLRSTATLMVKMLDRPLCEITIDSISDARDDLRRWLQERKYAGNSIRTYRNHLRILLQKAGDLGWKPECAIPEAWRKLLCESAKRNCSDILRFVARLKEFPDQVTTEDTDSWIAMRVQQGASYETARNKRGRFWKLLSDHGFAKNLPPRVLRRERFGIPLDDFSPELKAEVLALLNWKQAAFALERPKGAKHRPITSKRLLTTICELVGFMKLRRGVTEIRSLAQVIRRDVVTEFIMWAMNERSVTGFSLHCYFRLLYAAVRQYPELASIDTTWFKPLLDSIPVEAESEQKKRKATKYLEYSVLEAIPSRMQATRAAAAKKGTQQAAIVAMDELLIRWLAALPWRQRNVRECRIGGPNPNLFKAKIPTFVPIDKPRWVEEAENANPNAEFWQFHFSPEETKMKNEVHAVLPRTLIAPLEEFLGAYRPHLIGPRDPGTLFVTQDGTRMDDSSITMHVSQITLRFGGRRVTPHLFRDIVAFAWLKDHPKDYLTLSKILWHASLNTTIKTYGSRFNESSGVCAMDSWIEEREARTKSK